MPPILQHLDNPQYVSALINPIRMSDFIESVVAIRFARIERRRALRLGVLSIILPALLIIRPALDAHEKKPDGQASGQQMPAPGQAPAEPGQPMQTPSQAPAEPHGEGAPAEADHAAGGIAILGHFGRPEYLHVLLNPIPVYGLSMGLLALSAGLLMRSRRAIIAALLVIFVSGLMAWPVYYFGEQAYDRVRAMSDVAGGLWLDEHMARGMKLIYAFYLLAAVALAGIVAPFKWPRSSLPLAIAALVLGGATMGIGGWISYAGGHVRHAEFRFEPPPMPKMGAQKGMDHHGQKGAPPAPPGGQQQAQPMQHDGAMQSPQPMQNEAATQPAPLTAEQIEAARMQLEASRLQLEASRKQLEAADAAKQGSPSPKQAQPSPSPDGHQHKP
jgi:hypothetical protein